MQKYVTDKYNHERLPLINIKEYRNIDKSEEDNILEISDNKYNIDNLIFNENEDNDFSSSNFNSDIYEDLYKILLFVYL